MDTLMPFGVWAVYKWMSASLTTGILGSSWDRLLLLCDVCNKTLLIKVKDLFVKVAGARLVLKKHFSIA